MSNLERLLAKGAQVVGGDLILRHKTVGRFRNGDFLITKEGTEELQIIDVTPEAQEVEPPKAAPRKRVAAVKAPSPLTEDITVDVE
jgi:hypothetical protein